MAHFAIIVDADPSRRQSFLSSVVHRLKTLPKLVIGQMESGNLAAAWAHGATAPHSIHQAQKDFALLLGYAIDDAGQRLGAQAISNCWSNPAPDKTAFGGYFAAITYSTPGRLILGGDLLGLFPIYYAQCGEALIAASSPEFMSAHPHFERELDAASLAGILLFNGLFENRALLKGVRRLKPGCQFRWEKGVAREVETFRLQPIETERASDFETVIEQSDTELRRAIRWHRPHDTRSALMLSGGWDSRLIGGYLASEGITDNAVCLGRPTDLEIQVSSRVAAALRMHVHCEPCEPPAAQFLDAARTVSTWEHLAGGFSHLEMIPVAELVGQTAPTFWSGFSMEDLLAVPAPPDAVNPPTQGWSFPRYLHDAQLWGMSPQTIQSLLQPAQFDLRLDEMPGLLRREYERDLVCETQRFVRAKFQNRARFHAGSVLHRLSFRSWPLLPFLDRRLLQTQLTVPFELKLDRGLEKLLLSRRFPELARIPREHNSYWLEPLKPTMSSRALASLAKKFRRAYWQRWRREEPRRYFRCYDLNGPWWRAVRSEACSLIGELDGCLNRATVKALLPPPEVDIRLKNPISGGTPHRLLLGLILWSARRHF